MVVVHRVASYTTPKLVFNEEQEEALVEYIIRCCHLYYGLSITELKKLAYEFARKLNIVYPANWDTDHMAGKSWYYGFMLRHKNLSLRSPEQTSLNRIKSFCQENVDQFFDNYSAILETHKFEPHQIWNMDETGFPTVPTKFGKIIAVKGVKRVGQAASAERGTLVSMALAVNAVGGFVPPFFVFPRKNMQSYFMDSASPNADATCNESGWMQQNEFVKYIRHFLKYVNSSRQKPILLLLDNHTSHLSIEAIDLALENGIIMLTFPPHCSHKMQPLDVSVYGPLKGYYSTECKNWQTANAGKALDIRHIPGLVCAALDQALTPANIKSGFIKTGICPLKRNAFTESDFVQASLSGQISDVAPIENALNEEERRRIFPMGAACQTFSKSTKPSTSATTPTTMSRSSSMASVLSEIGPVQPAMPQKRSNRGRKPMKSTVLTSIENIAKLKEKRQKCEDAKKKKEGSTQKRKRSYQIEPAKKRTQPTRAAASKKESSSSSDEDVDFCMICMENLPAKLTKNNSIECNKCQRPFHLKCVNMSLS
ncbi:uncharacterized protein LOC116351222 [Contarinia nasturtii]|uniref:uncharacterized protein LOC116351222 n=1 Tax=Contarinia nasturtii TaxID=265458 RepID=UPI0012D4B476|nr:uncharacterized protein LOC116351222 [Contarinia nasturtii]